MATANKHRERSHRSYKQKQFNLEGFKRKTAMNLWKPVFEVNDKKGDK